MRLLSVFLALSLFIPQVTQAMDSCAAIPGASRALSKLAKASNAAQAQRQGLDGDIKMYERLRGDAESGADQAFYAVGIGGLALTAGAGAGLAVVTQEMMTTLFFIAGYSATWDLAILGAPYAEVAKLELPNLYYPDAAQVEYDVDRTLARFDKIQWKLNRERSKIESTRGVLNRILTLGESDKHSIVMELQIARHRRATYDLQRHYVLHASVKILELCLSKIRGEAPGVAALSQKSMELDANGAEPSAVKTRIAR